MDIAMITISNNMPVAAEFEDDANLVARTLAGNQEAFERIVSRYQSLICSLAYSSTGNVARSEDLAQETFVTAWKQLRALREPAKLRSWLCGIARNLINNNCRKETREPLHRAESLEIANDTASADHPPSDQVMSREEQAIVWRILEEIPEPYRETLILFYREEQSVESVAQQLDLSQDATKQRLSRGREMVRMRSAELIEGVLAKTRPGRAFTIAVIAALPGVVVGSASAAGLGAVGKAGVPAAKALLSAGALGGIIGALGGLLGGGFGTWATWQTARYQRQRDLIKRSVTVYAVCLAIFMTPFAVMTLIGWGIARRHQLTYGVSVAIWMLAFTGVTLGWTLWFTRKFRCVTAEEMAAGTSPLPESIVVRRVSGWSSRWEGRQWRSRTSFLGLPLIDINFRSPKAETLISKATLSALLPGKTGTARGWIAFGDRAFGVLFACGNQAFGGIAIGGISAGVLALGGLAGGLISIGGASIGLAAFGGLALGGFAWGGAAIGALASGGLAVGWLAFGGAAFGWHAAKGGLAWAHDFAVGGTATAAHANDIVAKQMISDSKFFQFADSSMNHAVPILNGPWFIIVIIALSLLFPALMLLIGYRRRQTPNSAT
jgi:RNA polymerase sigma factor (sigma-70 family)